MATRNPEDDDSAQLGRMDFQIEVVRLDEASRSASIRIVPDPRRYEQADIDGKRHYIDKYLLTAISEEKMAELCANRTEALPLYALSARINSAPAYAAARKVALDCELQGGGYIPPIEKPLAHRALEIDAGGKNLVFLSLDVCGSTALRRSNRSGFDHAYELLVRELGTVVGQFNGALLKVTGDGFIAYIDYPGFTRQCDHAIDLGLSLLRVLRESINPALRQAGLPAIKVRIGADYGSAVVRQVEIAATGFMAPEIASDALNRAVKIEQSAEEDEFRIGRRLYELIHVQWLERATAVSFDSSTIGLEDYKVYRVG